MGYVDQQKSLYRRVTPTVVGTYSERSAGNGSDRVLPGCEAEFLNVLWSHVRQGEFSLDLAIQHIDLAEDLINGQTYDVSPTEVLHLAPNPVVQPTPPPRDLRPAIGRSPCHL